MPFVGKFKYTLGISYFLLWLVSVLVCNSFVFMVIIIYCLALVSTVVHVGGVV